MLEAARRLVRETGSSFRVLVQKAKECKNHGTGWTVLGGGTNFRAAALGPLYRGTFLFGLACGISIALTPLHLDARGYQKEEIGTLALFFAMGLVLFAVPVGWLLRRWGGKSTLIVMLAGYALCVFLFPFAESYEQIAAVRFFDGIFSIGVWVSSETILLARAEEGHKGQLTSLYAVWLASGYVIGPLLATGLARVLSLTSTFVVGSVFAAAASVYIVLRLSRFDSRQSEVGSGAVLSAGESPPVVEEGAPLAPLELLVKIKTSCFAALSYGYFQSSVVLFLPLYLIESKGIPRSDTIVLPGLFCFGMLLFSTRVGRLGDRIGHLRVVSIFSALGTCCVLGFVFVDQYIFMCILVFAAGATFATMSPVALALLGVVVPKASLGRANSIYNTFYAGGMLMGPPLTSVIFAHYGGPAMLYHLAALWTGFVVFSLVYFADDPAYQGSLRGKLSSIER